MEKKARIIVTNVQYGTLREWISENAPKIETFPFSVIAKVAGEELGFPISASTVATAMCDDLRIRERRRRSIVVEAEADAADAADDDGAAEQSLQPLAEMLRKLEVENTRDFNAVNYLVCLLAKSILSVRNKNRLSLDEMEMLRHLAKNYDALPKWKPAA